MLRVVRNIILGTIDFVHQPFARFIDRQTFRYLACGSFNAGLHVLLYYIAYNFILRQHDVYLSFKTIPSEIAAYLIAFSISFPAGFIASKYLVFQESNIKGRVQLFRYAVLVAFCIILNILFIKLFVNHLHFYPTPSQALTTAIVAVFSYFSQRNFTFKVKEMNTFSE